MITTDAQLQQAVDQMARLFRALKELRREAEQQNPGLFAVLAEGPLDMIEQLRAQIDEHTGVAAMRDREVRLTGQARKRADDALGKLVSERIETRTGTIRELDLDERTFLLRLGDDATVTRCTFSEELYETAKDAFDRQVRVRASMRHAEGRRGGTASHRDGRAAPAGSGSVST